MELCQLRYFLTAASAGSLSEAATVAEVAQSALSRQIRQLENELGVQLFYRHGRGIRLTDEGARFHTEIASLVRQLDQAKADIGETARIPGGRITFGMPPSISSAIGADVVSRFLADFPQVKLHLVDGLSGYVSEWLTVGRVDMAIINNARKVPYIRMDPLLEVDLLLFGRRPDIEALAPGSGAFPTAGLAGLPMLLVGRNHGLRRELDAAMQTLGIELDIKAEVDALAPLKKLVLDGHGFTILPHAVVFQNPGAEAFAFRRLVAPELSQRFMLAYSLQRPTTLAMRELARRVRTELARAVSEGRMVGRLSGARAGEAGG